VAAAAAQTVGQGGWRSVRGGAWNLGEPLGYNNWLGGWPERAGTGGCFAGEEEGGNGCMWQLQAATDMACRAGLDDVMAHEGLEAGRSLVT
jgi:hypothetical protein